MLANFRSYQLAVSLYQLCKTSPLHGSLRDQLLRAGSSICLNLAEGSAKPSKKDRLRFYTIAFASLREVQAIVDLERDKLPMLVAPTDTLGAHLYKLCRT